MYLSLQLKILSVLFDSTTLDEFALTLNGITNLVPILSSLKQLAKCR